MRAALLSILILTASAPLAAGCAGSPRPDPFADEASIPASPSPSTPPDARVSSIADICAYPGGKAVLDRDLPGLTERPEYMFFKGMTLRSLVPMSKGQLTDADLVKVDTDLAALPVRQAQIR